MLLAAVLPAFLVAGAAPALAAVRLNHLQVVGTHNSYHREISEPEQALFDAALGRPGEYDRTLAYSHATVGDQFALQRVRGLELDSFGDPAGGLYASPLIRRAAGLPALTDPAWSRPGTKVLHIADADYESTCVALTSCLGAIRSWSAANPRHVPLLVLLELKQSDPLILARGGVTAPAWDGPALDSLDAEIRSVLGSRRLLVPDDVRRRGLTLEQSIRRRGWPTLEAARGRVLFLLDNDPGPIRDAYIAGRPSLEGRVLFTNSTPGSPDAAFIKANDPRGDGGARIRSLVRRGYLVRTRADEPLATVLSGSRARLRAALASGAHVVSTDFPEVGMSARYRSSYVARLPGGRVARCNPVSAGSDCRNAALEP
jgi:hypothetical protein